MYKSLGKELFLALASGVRQIFRFEFKYKKIFFVDFKQSVRYSNNKVVIKIY